MTAIEDVARAYGLAWSTTNDAERAALLERCWTDDGVYCDPRSQAAGRAALSDLIGTFQQSRPGYRILLASGIDAHHEFVRMRWVMVDSRRNAVLEGFDVGELVPDGRFRRITGFFDPWPELAVAWPEEEVWRGG
jgi:hypothetical protein